MCSVSRGETPVCVLMSRGVTPVCAHEQGCVRPLCGVCFERGVFSLYSYE